MSRNPLGEHLQTVQSSLPASVKLIAVTKTVPSEVLRIAYEAGIRDFAESRVQEALPKQAELADLTDICWHFIGHLQANKARKVIEHFTWIHSVHSLALAQRLNQLAIASDLHPQICLQVKLLPDDNKSGWNPDQLRQDLPILESLTQINIQGLMTILPLGLTIEERFQTFQSLQTLRRSLTQSSSLALPELSMGMSNDYPEALRAGATMVRLGSLLFGDRDPLPNPSTV